MTHAHATNRSTETVPAVIKQLCGLVAQLEETFPERSFTLDGHLVGSIGEVLAAANYGLTLLPMNEAKHDAEAGDGRLVQIKVTQGRTVGLRSAPDHLLVLKLFADGSTAEIFNGPGAPVWDAAGKMQSNGQRAIGLTKLQALMANVLPEQRIPPVTAG